MSQLRIRIRCQWSKPSLPHSVPATFRLPWLWVADDTVIVNGRGETFPAQVFVQGNIRAKLCIEIQRARVSGEKVFWTNTVSTTSLEQLGIASMEVNADAVVRGGKIVANRNYYTPRALARLRPACDTPQGRTTRMFGHTCAEFVQLGERFTESVLAGLKPFSVETDFMSLPGYRQYLTR